MTLALPRTSVFARPAYWRRLWRRMGRSALMAIGWLLIVVGVVGAVLPGHLGVPLLVIGLIIVLRSSFQARRQFIGLQRRHPRIVLPIRRLLRRDPEVLPVAWQQLVRLERMILPRGWRFARSLRRRFFRSRAVPRTA
jgi:hypothetical protein